MALAEERREEERVREALERLVRAGFPIVMSIVGEDGARVFSSIPVVVVDGIVVTRQILVDPDGEGVSILNIVPASEDKEDVATALAAFAKFALDAEVGKLAGPNGTSMLVQLALPLDRDAELDIVVRLAPAVDELAQRVSGMSKEEMETLFVAAGLFPGTPYTAVVQALAGERLARMGEHLSVPVIQVISEIGKCRGLCLKPTASPSQLLLLTGDLERAREAIRLVATLATHIAAIAGDAESVLWLNETAKRLEEELARSSPPEPVRPDKLVHIEREAARDLEGAFKKVELALAGVPLEEKAELLGLALSQGLRLTSLMLLAAILRSSNIVSDVDPVMEAVRASKTYIYPLHASKGKLVLLLYGSEPGAPALLAVVKVPKGLNHLVEQLNKNEPKGIVTVVIPGRGVTRAAAPFELEEDKNKDIGEPALAAT